MTPIGSANGGAEITNVGHSLVIKTLASQFIGEKENEYEILVPYERSPSVVFDFSHESFHLGKDFL